MDLTQAESHVRTHKYGGLLYAHTYGEASTPKDVFDELKQLDEALLLVDDRCLCVPQLEPDLTNSADLQLYSTGYAKIVDLGFGGYAFLKDELSYETTHLSFNPQAHEQVEKDYKHAVENRAAFVYKDSDWLETDAKSAFLGCVSLTNQ